MASTGIRETISAALRKERETVVIADGLAPGEWVCTSPLETIDEGSQVKVVSEANES